MVTDLSSNYSSPAGREFTLAAGRTAAVNPASRVLDLGCGHGEGACNLALEFRCRVTAVDMNQENIDFAREYATQRGVSHLITFQCADVLDSDFSREPFDVVMAEGGVISFLSRKRGLELCSRWLAPRGWLAFSDLIFLTDQVPEEVRGVFEDHLYHYESESSYRSLVEHAGFDIHLMCMVPPSGWDNYYAHMAKRLEDERGFFADKRVKLAFHREIDVFYRLDGLRYAGYLSCLARKK
jgi:cyclopropane fatty-acyl-phospholipid synthase-like methyltransferase